MTKTLSPEQKEHLAEAIDEFVVRLGKKGRRGRKDSDVSGLYTTVEKEFARSWKELAADIKREWKDPAIAHTFEAKRKGPTSAQTDALYNRARERADKRQKKAIDDNAKKAVSRGATSAQVDVGLNIGWNVRSPAAEKFLKNRGAERVKGISENSRKRIRKLVLQGAEQGKTYKEIGKEIDDLIRSWPRKAAGIQSRGELIAITEMGEAYEEGRREVQDELEKSGLDVEKSWLTAGDEKLCPVCTSAEADGWISSKEEFSNGESSPLAHAGCRCDLLLQVV